MATTSKLSRPSQIYPPREVLGDTKTRRAWLAKRAEELAADGFTVKTCGVGSYQYLSVQKLVEVDGRIQKRGTCQVCGGVQAVERGVIHLHGYKRPRWGYVVGRCSGTEESPAEGSTRVTKSIVRSLERELPALQRASTEAEKAFAATTYKTPLDERKALGIAATAAGRALLNAQQYHKHLTTRVLPRLGKDLYEVLIPTK